MMTYKEIVAAGGMVRVSLSHFSPENGGDAEYSAVIHPVAGACFAAQWQAVREAFDNMCALAVPVFVRIFLSDPVNQSPLLSGVPPCAVSVVGQAPLDGGMPKVAMWAYFREHVVVEKFSDGLYKVSDASGISEYWQGGLSCPGADSRDATEALLAAYAESLRRHGATLARNCMRTWFFVRDVDLTYAGMVLGRNDIFAREGLLPSTHFIASTGIGGFPADTAVSVMLDTYAVDGLDPRNVSYLKASDYLNPTSEYGVAFERATSIDFPDRRHVLVSGTASINNKGAIENPGDICGQLARMCVNVEALLDEGGCTPGDITHAIVYIRDTADAGTVASFVSGRYPGLPFIVVLAPVCRPGWLVEMECMAVR